ncbi:hypothetical protein GCM10010103_66340 [Streptomyces paradoxus]|uniref:Uncharacterized protein n=1 Tax=Streptomyces paradoxus TaxID=66375 RepID=A0A7W9WL01_9ACTN|nr:hypothetical protein [Streptomyces paradoxus]MBB6080958.1 hypothetical protein [Streptomyces paradoxus]
MSASNPRPATAEPRWPHQSPDDTWEQARDAAFAEFLRRRLTYIDATGCREERQLAAGIERILSEWEGNRTLARAADVEEFAARISTLGWALRSLAEPAWRGTPGWDEAFEPLALPPGARPKAVS